MDSNTQFANDLHEFTITKYMGKRHSQLYVVLYKYYIQFWR